MVNIVHQIKVILEANTGGFKTGLRTARAGIVRTMNDLKGFNNISTKVGATVGMMSRRFQYWALSMLFTSMMLKRTFSAITKAATSTFIKIMESSGFAGSSIQQLAVQFEYLKFVIGSAINRAIEPLMPAINKVINIIAQWIMKHPKLTTAILALIGIMGFLLGVVALVVTNMSWLVPVFEAFGVVIAAVLSPVGLLILGLIAVIAWVIALMVKMGGFKQFWTNVWNGIKSVFVIIWDSMVTAAAFAWNAIIAGLIILIDWVNKAIAALNKLFKLKMKKIGTSGLVNSMSDYQQGDIINEYSDSLPQNQPANTGSVSGSWGQSSVNIQTVNVQSNDMSQMMSSIKSVVPNYTPM